MMNKMRRSNTSGAFCKSVLLSGVGRCHTNQGRISINRLFSQQLFPKGILIILQFMIGCLDVNDILVNRVDEQVSMMSEEDQPIAQRAQIRVSARRHAFGSVQERSLCFPCVLRDSLCSLRIPELLFNISDVL